LEEEEEDEDENDLGGALGMYRRNIVPRPVNTGDSHWCERNRSVAEGSGRTVEREAWSVECCPEDSGRPQMGG
jgi:hypothetical protein